MATRRTRRRKSQSSNFMAFVPAIIALGLLALILNNLSTTGTLFLVLVGATLAVLFFVRHQRLACQKQILRRVTSAIEQHQHALVSYYHQTRREDLFGNWDETRWLERIDTFLRHQVVPEITDFRAWRNSATGREAVAAVHNSTVEMVNSHKASNPLAQVDVASLTPLQYEKYCADLLDAQGWRVRLTQATRDGGADFIAEKNDWRMIVQCKRYSQPVGNKAVQEINAAVRLYNGNVACVVAPSGFSRQAEQEALGLSVHLLHHSALPAFAEKLAD